MCRRARRKIGSAGAFLGLIGSGARAFGSSEIGRDLGIAAFDHAFDLGDHALADAEIDRSQHQGQPEPLRLIDEQKLVKLRHLTLSVSTDTAAEGRRP